MQLGRRTFLKLLAIGSALAHALRPGRALAGESAVGIHRATRNTLLGAIGSGLREMQAAPTPFKGYVGRRRLRLGDHPVPTGPPLADLLHPPDGARPAASSLSRDQLARILYFTNGDTGSGDGDPYKLRAAPSAGALYAGEIYVLARDVESLERGIYYYDVGGHELVYVADLDDAAVRDAFEDPTAAQAAALVCLSNMFERYEQRYSNRGYRYGLIDTGHIGENLRIAAAAAGIAHRSEPRFCDDCLHRVLGIDGAEEALCAVHFLGASADNASPAPSAAGAPRRMVEKAATGAKITNAPEPTLRYHEATKLVFGEAKRPRREPQPSSDASVPAATEAAIPLPAPAAPVTTAAEQCIAARRSPSAFARREISVAQLGFVTRAARSRDDASHLELWVAVNRVEGLERGLYRYDGEREQLAVVRREDLTETLPRACLGQAKAADAAAGFLMVGRIRAAAAQHHERAYRDLLIEAGAAGERVYLAAEALGLSARNLAAFLDEDLNGLLGLDGSERAVVHMTMLGRPA